MIDCLSYIRTRNMKGERKWLKGSYAVVVEGEKGVGSSR